MSNTENTCLTAEVQQTVRYAMKIPPDIKHMNISCSRVTYATECRLSANSTIIQWSISLFKGATESCLSTVQVLTIPLNENIWKYKLITGPALPVSWKWTDRLIIIVYLCLFIYNDVIIITSQDKPYSSAISCPLGINLHLLDNNIFQFQNYPQSTKYNGFAKKFN